MPRLLLKQQDQCLVPSECLLQLRRASSMLVSVTATIIVERQAADGHDAARDCC